MRTLILINAEEAKQAARQVLFHGVEDNNTMKLSDSELAAMIKVAALVDNIAHALQRGSGVTVELHHDFREPGDDETLIVQQYDW